MREPSENIEYYDHFATRYELFFNDFSENMEQEGHWIADALPLPPGGRILDASCGTGRQAIPLARRGFAVTASDPSGAMLEEARRIASELGVHVSFVRAGFLELSGALDERFDAVIALGNGLSHLAAPDEIGRALVSLRACCRDGGEVLVGIKDYAAIRARPSRFHGHRILDADAGRTLLFETWDIEEPYLHITAFILEGTGRNENEGLWRVQSGSTCEYMLEEAELRILAQKAGFTAVRRLRHPSEAVFNLRADE